jgi:hypothetical protein
MGGTTQTRNYIDVKILIGCEESGTVRDAFLKRGHDAWSCDLQPTRSPGPHYEDAIKRQEWDLIILHPPCDALACCGNRWYGEGMPRHMERLEALNWTTRLWLLARLTSRKVVMENPLSVIFPWILSKDKFSELQYVQPWQFGHGETKKTGLLRYGLPELKPTNVVEGREQRVWKMPPGPNRKRDRSVTYQGIADAMAGQWG